MDDAADSPPDAPVDPETQTPTRVHVWNRHPWRLGALAVAAVVVLFGAYTVGRYLLRSHPGAKSIDSAVEALRSSTSLGSPGETSFVRPATGVYEAAGEGSEHISTPPNSQDDGATMPVTVSYLPDGCWRWHIDYNRAHWHEFDYCPQGTQLLLVAQRNYQLWDFGSLKVTNLGTYTCDPPSPIVVDDPQAGQEFPQHCTGENSGAPGLSNTDGPATIVGLDTVDIGGTSVDAVHQTRVQQMTGAQTGQTTEDWWYAVDTGLPVKAERHYKLDTDTIIGSITYTEAGSWQLTSMTPRT